MTKAQHQRSLNQCRRYWSRYASDCQTAAEAFRRGGMAASSRVHEAELWIKFLEREIMETMKYVREKRRKTMTQLVELYREEKRFANAGDLK